MPHEEPPRRMRSARLVGLSPDGKSLIVVTESGEELIIEADERLRAAVRGDRPRLGQLEIEMQTSLTPVIFRRGSGPARPRRRGRRRRNSTGSRRALRGASPR